MSRVGKAPIVVPDGVTVTLEGQRCTVKGPKGELTHEAHADIRVTQDGGSIVVTRPSDAPKHRSLHGLTRALLNNMVVGVTDGFRKSLEIQGTGYRAQKQGETLVLNVGFSHPVEMEPLEGASFELESPTILHIEGVDKQIVGQQAALVRRVRPPDVYRGKGIRYLGEQIRLKAGKAKAAIA
jgi:large subunit ribosomal protein L6